MQIFKFQIFKYLNVQISNIQMFKYFVILSILTFFILDSNSFDELKNVADELQSQVRTNLETSKSTFKSVNEDLFNLSRRLQKGEEEKATFHYHVL